MVNSSKKSSRPSPSQPDFKDGKGKKAAGKEPRRERPHTATSEVERPFSTGGKYLKIPMGKGFTLFFEGRQVGLLVLSFLLYLFAAFVASEWIYLLSAAFLVAVVLGVIVPFVSLSGIKADYSLPQEMGSNEAATLKVHLVRSFPFGPLSVLVPTRALRMTLTMVKRGTDGKPSTVTLNPEPCFVEVLKSEDWFSFPTPELRRGIYFLESLTLSTCFPFGIAWWSRTISLRGENQETGATITVFPPVHAISGNFLYRLSGITSPMGQATSSSVIVHQSSSFRSVREYRSGDSLRHIHWASSARLGRFLVREFDSETLPVFDVMLNLRANYRNEDQFELTVSLINSLVHLGHNIGHMPRLLLNPPLESGDVQSLLFDLPQMPPGLGLVAETLARVEPITKVAANRMSFDEVEDEIDYREAWSHICDRPILTVVPSGDKIVKYSPGKGDVVCCPVDIIEVPPNWAEEEEVEEVKVDKSVDFKSARGAAVKKNKTAELGPTTGMAVARLEWEGDFESL